MNNLRSIREEYNLNQKAIAKYLNVDLSTYSRYENEYRDIPIDILIKLAKYYETSTDYLLGLTNIKTHFRKKEPLSNKVYK